MSRKCSSCGFVNDATNPVCGLCGAPLPLDDEADAHPHRVPSGVRPSVLVDDCESLADDRDTDLDIGGAAADLTIDETGGHSTPRTDLGEAAALAAASGTGGHRAAGSGLIPRPPAPPISDIGEAAGVAAVVQDDYGREPATLLLGRVKLVVEQGLIIGEQYLLAEPEMIIGRGDQASHTYPDIDLSGQDNDYVHRVHARLRFHDMNARLSVEHLGGSNPTLVNNEPVELNELVEIFIGDRLRVGRVVMRVAPV